MSILLILHVDIIVIKFYAYELRDCALLWCVSIIKIREVIVLSTLYKYIFTRVTS